MNALNIDEKDTQFFKDVHDLMKSKYPEMIEKYGIWRVHHHFPLDSDEALYETSNANTKESTLRIIKKRELPQNSIISTWKFDEGGSSPSSWCCDD